MEQHCQSWPSRFLISRWRNNDIGGEWIIQWVALCTVCIATHFGFWWQCFCFFSTGGLFHHPGRPLVPNARSFTVDCWGIGELVDFDMSWMRRRNNLESSKVLMLPTQFHQCMTNVHSSVPQDERGTKKAEHMGINMFDYDLIGMPMNFKHVRWLWRTYLNQIKFS